MSDIRNRLIRVPVALAIVCVVAFMPGGIAVAREREVAPGRNPNSATQSLNVLAELADEVSQKMLASEAFARVIADQEMPLLVVGDINNRTTDETIQLGDMSRRISEVVIASGLVEWREGATNRFDLIISPILTSVVMTNGRRSEQLLTLTLTLSDVRGAVRGRWSAEKLYTR